MAVIVFIGIVLVLSISLLAATSGTDSRDGFDQSDFGSRRPNWR